MPVLEEIERHHQEMVGWRRDLHAHPELGFAETRTSTVIHDRLRSFGVDALHSFNGTGVIAVIHGRMATMRSACGRISTPCRLPSNQAYRMRRPIQG